MLVSRRGYVIFDFGPVTSLCCSYRCNYRLNLQSSWRMIQSTDVRFKHKMKGIVSSEEESVRETLFGFDEAMEIIWKHQNPPDCSKAKFLIVSPFNSGFGSTIHVEASMLSTALKLGRVMIKSTGHSTHDWIVDNDFCRSQKKTDFECYYEPLSKCTIHDALQSTYGFDWKLETIKHIEDIVPGQEDKIIEKYKNYRAVRAASFPSQGYGHFTLSTQFKSILDCLPMPQAHWYYWWRAVSASYYVRPNAATLKALEKHRTLPIKLNKKDKQNSKKTALSIPDKNNGQCISIYVRHGDKSIEMELVPFARYAEAVEIVMTRYLNNSNPVVPGTKGKPAIFIGSESNDVLKEAVAWGKKHDFQVLFTNIFHRNNVSALCIRPAKGEHHHPDEYLSMLLNLEYSLKCDAFIGTLASNSCRLVDEMRCTVGIGAQRPFIDLSKETCGKDICINTGVQHYLW